MASSWVAGMIRLSAKVDMQLTRPSGLSSISPAGTLEEVIMATLTLPRQRKPSKAAESPVSVGAGVALPRDLAATTSAKKSPTTLRQPVVGSVPTPRTGTLSRLARPLVACYNLLAGPPLSDRDRFKHAVAEARIREYQGLINSRYHIR